MRVSKPVFTCIKTKIVDDVQRWVNKGSDMPYFIETHMIWRISFSLFVCFNLGHGMKVSAERFLDF